MTSIAADFESENTSRCQKAGKENLRNIPKKVNVGNGDAKKLFKSPKPSSKMSETAVEIQPEKKTSVVQGYARKERRLFGIDPNSSPFQNTALKPAKISAKTALCATWPCMR